MPLSPGAAPPRSGPARTWPLGSIRWRRGFAVNAFGGGTEARGPEESDLQAAMMHAAAAVPSMVERRQGFTEVLRERCAPRGAQLGCHGAGRGVERALAESVASALRLGQQSGNTIPGLSPRDHERAVAFQFTTVDVVRLCCSRCRTFSSWTMTILCAMR